MTRNTKIILAVALVLILGMGAFVAAVYNSYKNTLDGIYVEDPDVEDGEEDPYKDDADVQNRLKEPFTVLMYGIDQREGQGDQGRPDTLMLALVDPELLRVSLISIPRDSLVSIPGRQGRDKINHSFSGGAALTIQTIEEWLEIDIDGYVAIDFQGFIELVNLVGGVDVFVDATIIYDDPMDGTHIRLDQGQQVLDGKNALDFVRARLDNRGPRFYTSDYKRMERQQLVLKALASELVSVRSLPKIFSMMEVVADNVSTTLNPKELDALIRRFYRFNMGNLDTTSIIGEAIQIRGIWYEDVPTQEIQRIQEYYQRFMDREEVLVPGEEQDTEEQSTGAAEGNQTGSTQSGNPQP